MARSRRGKSTTISEDTADLAAQVSSLKAAGLTGREAGDAAGMAKSTANNHAQVHELLAPELLAEQKRGRLRMADALHLIRLPMAEQLAAWRSGKVPASPLNKAEIHLLVESCRASSQTDAWKAAALEVLEAVLSNKPIVGVWPPSDQVRLTSKWAKRTRRTRR